MNRTVCLLGAVPCIKNGTPNPNIEPHFHYRKSVLPPKREQGAICI
ncbi:MAG: hypothetical protein PHQ75_05720 [Thermoguttaceae bacterium]|nr:hypothetical protein [Thermoguttaceae bacterium]